MGVIANFAVSEYKARVGRGIGSEALEADDIHSRIDGLVLAGAFAAIGLAGLGLTIADPLVGLGISGAIGGDSQELYYRMMDAIDPTMLDEVIEAAKRVDVFLASMTCAPDGLAENWVATMHINCDPNATLRSPDATVILVEEAVRKKCPPRA